MGIELKLTGNCEGCKLADVYLSTVETSGGSRITVANCRHEDVCQKWHQMRMDEILKEAPQFTPEATETWPPPPSLARPWNCGSALDYKDIKFDYKPEPADLLKAIQEEMKGRP